MTEVASSIRGKIGKSVGMVGLWLICLLFLKSLFGFAVWLPWRHTQVNVAALPPLGVSFASCPISALFLDSSSHTYGTQSQHLQPGFPPVWRVCSLRFPGHEHQGATLFCALCLPLGQQWALGCVSYLRTTQVAFGSVGGASSLW